MSPATQQLDDLDFGTTSRDPRDELTLSERDLGATPEVHTAGRVIDLSERLREQNARQLARSIVDPFRSLADGWDSYGARATDPAAVSAAENWLAALAQVRGLARPQAAPSPDVGVSIEWHLSGVDVVISIGPANEPPSAYVAQAGQEWEFDDIREMDAASRVNAALAALIAH